jgi:prophage DNA circulation protein
MECFLQIITASNNSAAAEAERNAKDIEIKETVIELLQPGISKIKEFMTYVTAAMNVIDNTITKIATIQNIEGSSCNSSPRGLYTSIIKLLDTLFKLDNIKDMRGSMKSDFSRYKRAIGSHTTRSLSGKNQKLYFLLLKIGTKVSNYSVELCRTFSPQSNITYY